MKKIVFSALILNLAACASVGVQVLKQQPAKASNCAIDVYADEKDVKREYETVALIDSKTGSTLFDKKTISAAIDLAKPKACQAGADAIIVMSSDRRGVNLASYGEAKATIKAIKYK
ncbi:hypothetical protein [Fibrella aestuarina]|uniref:hypothetical protein n=1 Tax=Fibrella aestuarina TaxID=651143 RepID=UPI0002DF0E75|nr:hypothetical protein [Fibrella aestuarina]